MRTLANLTNPSEVRSLLQLVRKELQTEPIPEDLLMFAHRVMPRRYRNLSRITTQTRDLLFAELEGANEAKYSEFHMSSGERAILRISKDISDLHDALILIDEVEAGLHPYTQQQAMLEFQRIALRNSLQIIVASHSPVVLESVPPEARLFLDRDEHTAEVSLVPPYRDILQKALYGQSRDQFSILCEDDVAEGIIRGFLDVVNVKLNLRHDDVLIGRDTGKDEFQGHVRTLVPFPLEYALYQIPVSPARRSRASWNPQLEVTFQYRQDYLEPVLGKFGKLSDFVLVLDGDARDKEIALKNAAAEYGQTVQPLFLPGKESPEAWMWRVLDKQREHYAQSLGITSLDMEQRMKQIEQLIVGGVQQQSTYKVAVEALADELNRTVSDIARSVGQYEAQQPHGEVAAFITQLEEQITTWRQP